MHLKFEITCSFFVLDLSMNLIMKLTTNISFFPKNALFLKQRKVKLNTFNLTTTE